MVEFNPNFPSLPKSNDYTTEGISLENGTELGINIIKEKQTKSKVSIFDANSKLKPSEENENKKNDEKIAALMDEITKNKASKEAKDAKGKADKPVEAESPETPEPPLDIKLPDAPKDKASKDVSSGYVHGRSSQLEGTYNEEHPHPNAGKTTTGDNGMSMTVQEDGTYKYYDENGEEMTAEEFQETNPSMYKSSLMQNWERVSDGKGGMAYRRGDQYMSVYDYELLQSWDLPDAFSKRNDGRYVNNKTGETISESFYQQIVSAYQKLDATVKKNS